MDSEVSQFIQVKNMWHEVSFASLCVWMLLFIYIFLCSVHIQISAIRIFLLFHCVFLWACDSVPGN